MAERSIEGRQVLPRVRPDNPILSNGDLVRLGSTCFGLGHERFTQGDRRGAVRAYTKGVHFAVELTSRELRRRGI